MMWSQIAARRTAIRASMPPTVSCRRVRRQQRKHQRPAAPVLPEGNRPQHPDRQLGNVAAELNDRSRLRPGRCSRSAPCWVRCHYARSPPPGRAFHAPGARPAPGSAPADQALSRGMRLRGPQPRPVIGERHVVPAAAAGFLPGPQVTLLVHRVLRFPLDYLAGGETQRGRPRAHHRPGGSPAWVAVDVTNAGRGRPGHLAMAPAPGRARLGCGGRPSGGPGGSRPGRGDRLARL
jgi:hypothetical protein